MKNLFLNFNSGKSRENGRFLYDVESVEKKFDLEKQEILQEVTVKKENLSASAEAHEKQVNFSQKIKTETTKGNTEKKEITPEQAEKIAQDCMKLVASESPAFEAALKSPDPAKAIRDYTENPPQESREKFLKLIKTKADEHGFKDHLTHGFENPKNLGNFAKIFTAFFSVGFISNEGGFKDSMIKGLKWGGTAAALSHPMVTGTASHALKGIGEGGYKILSYPTSALVDFIYEPGKFFDKAKKGENPFIKSDMVESIEMMKTTMDPLLLRKKGMNFSPDLNSIFDAINSGKKKDEVPAKIRSKAVEFLAQTENLAAKTDPKNLSLWGFNIFQNDPTHKVSDEQYRLVLMGKSREKIINFFGKDDKTLKDDVKYKLKSIQKNLDSKSKNKLKEYGIKDLTQVVAVGGKNFAEIAKEKSHGVGRALDNMAGTSLITYILIFLLTKGVMGGSKLLQNGWKKTEDTRKNLYEKPITTVAKGIWFPFKTVGKGLGYLLTRPFKWLKRKAVLNVGKERFLWNENQINAYNKLSRKEKNKIVDSLKKTVQEKKDKSNLAMENLRKKVGKKRKWWSMYVLKGVDKKTLKNDPKYKKIIEGIKDAKNGDLKDANFLKPEEWKNAFKSIKSSNEEVYKILFP